MEELNIIEEELQENNTIQYNYHFLKWYYTSTKNIMDDKERDKVFSLLTYSFLEDPLCFLRIMLYIANTRRSDSQEISYKVIIHFLGVMFPEVLYANLDLFIKLGNKKDTLYFLQCNTLTPRVLKWVRHMAKEDNDFEQLNKGIMIDVKSPITIRYKARNKDFKSLLEKILDDPSFNNIII
jgi:hypothetical protein